MRAGLAGSKSQNLRMVNVADGVTIRRTAERPGSASGKALPCRGLASERTMTHRRNRYDQMNPPQPSDAVNDLGFRLCGQSGEQNDAGDGEKFPTA